MSDQDDANIADSSAATDESTVSGGEDDSSSSGNVPFHEHPRWQEKQQQIKTLESEVADLRSTLDTQKQPEPEEKIPDFYDNPEAFAEYVENRTLNKLESKRTMELNQKAEADRVIDDQYSKIRELYPEEKVDEDAIADYALTEEVYDAKGNPNLIRAYKEMRKDQELINQGKQEVLKSIKRGKTAPIAASSGNQEFSQPNFSQQDLRGMSTEQLLDKLARK